jgi:hypothetical protein
LTTAQSYFDLPWQSIQIRIVVVSNKGIDKGLSVISVTETVQAWMRFTVLPLHQNHRFFHRLPHRQAVRAS